MCRNMTIIQWHHWVAYMGMNPRSEERWDKRFALVVQALWNVQIAKSKGGKFRELWQVMNLFRMGDVPEYMPPPPTRNQSSKELWARLKQMMIGHAKPPKKTQAPKE
jgi:hypothetical protein